MASERKAVKYHDRLVAALGELPGLLAMEDNGVTLEDRGCHAGIAPALRCIRCSAVVEAIDLLGEIEEDRG